MTRLKRRLILAGRIARGVIVGIPALTLAYLGWFVWRMTAYMDGERLERSTSPRVWMPTDKPERGE